MLHGEGVAARDGHRMVGAESRLSECLLLARVNQNRIMSSANTRIIYTPAGTQISVAKMMTTRAARAAVHASKSACFGKECFRIRLVSYRIV